MAGTWLTTSAFGKRLMQLDFRALQQAGDLRFGLVRTREHAGDRLSAYHVSWSWGHLWSLRWLPLVLPRVFFMGALCSLGRLRFLATCLLLLCVLLTLMAGSLLSASGRC